MTDCFALLEEPRRPWLDAVSLKDKFLALSASLHPDKVHSAGESKRSTASKKFAELNAAYRCLADAKSRLLHLIELESGTKPIDVREIPDSFANSFTEIAAICAQADRFLAAKANAVNMSPLLQVQYFERAQEWIGKLNAAREKLAGLGEKLSADLKSVDNRWIATGSDKRAGLLSELENLYRLFSFFNRWNSQIQERAARLSL